jgi:hypothetical protein
MDYVDVCPPSVVQAIREADLRSYDSRNLITWAETEAGRGCAVAALDEVARRLTPDSDLAVIDLFWNAVATYAPMLDADQIETVRLAYLRIPYDPALSFNYFLGLRNTGIDIRGRLRNRVPINWNFTSTRRDAQTWDYYLYLASLNEPGALAALAAKIADTASGNDATQMLRSLSDLRVDGVDAILKGYAGDPRRADGVSGPGLPLSKNIELMLMRRAAAQAAGP